MDREKKVSLLNKIAEEIRNCQKCELYQSATKAVPGEGSAEAQVVFVGEAPGYYEDQQGRPFVGRSGKLLTESLEKIGLKREDVFITNVLHHRPPGNRDPLPEEVTVCRKFFLRQLAIIRPRVVATLGRFALNIFLPEAKISQDRGKIKRLSGVDFILFPLYHPSAALRSTKVKEIFEADILNLGKILSWEESEFTDQKVKTKIESSQQTDEFGKQIGFSL